METRRLPKLNGEGEFPIDGFGRCYGKEVIDIVEMKILVCSFYYDVFWSKVLIVKP